MRTALTVARGFVPVTLVITVYNSAPELPELLASIGRLRVLPSEITFTDLGSTDGTVDLLRAWMPPSRIPVRVITSPGASTAVGRNLAIESSYFDHIAVTDGQVCLHPEWLARMWTELSAGNAEFKKTIEALQAYRSDQNLWWQVAEYSFDSFMVRSRLRSR